MSKIGCDWLGVVVSDLAPPRLGFFSLSEISLFEASPQFYFCEKNKPKALGVVKSLRQKKPKRGGGSSFRFSAA